MYQTTACNFHCSFCQRQTGKIEASPDVSPALIGRVLALYPIKSCCIAGFGEPLLSSSVFEVVGRLNQEGISPSIITNGSRIVERGSEIKGVLLDHVVVSLNEAGAGEHARRTKTTEYRTVLDGIAWLQKNGIPVVLSKVVLRSAYKSIPEFLLLADTLNVSKAILVNTLPYAPGETICFSDTKAVKEIEEYKRLPAAKIARKWPVYLKEQATGSCNSPWCSLGINGNGNITGCRRVLGPSVEFGFFDDPGIWFGPSLENLRGGVKGKGKFAALCARCFGNHK